MSCSTHPSPSQAIFPGLKGMGWKEWWDLRLCWYNLEHPCKTGGTGTEQQNPVSTPGTWTWTGSGVVPSETLQCMWAVEDGKLMFFQETQWFGSSGVRKEDLWLTLAQCTTLLNSSQGMQAAKSNLSERGLWLFYINLHYRTVWHLYLSAFSWGLRLPWLKTTEKFSL